MLRLLMPFSVFFLRLLWLIVRRYFLSILRTVNIWGQGDGSVDKATASLRTADPISSTQKCLVGVVATCSHIYSQGRDRDSWGKLASKTIRIPEEVREPASVESNWKRCPMSGLPTHTHLYARVHPHTSKHAYRDVHAPHTCKTKEQ